GGCCGGSGDIPCTASFQKYRLHQWEVATSEALLIKQLLQRIFMKVTLLPDVVGIVGGQPCGSSRGVIPFMYLPVSEL
uniref:Uncharacterized protein n=1 Tax=Parascaris univalens TaxID=6257 RepID=A0A915A4U9_PARUN